MSKVIGLGFLYQ